MTVDPLTVAPACVEGFYRFQGALQVFWGGGFHEVHKAAGGVSIFGVLLTYPLHVSDQSRKNRNLSAILKPIERTIFCTQTSGYNFK